MWTSALQSRNSSLLDSQHGVVETVLVDDGRHALNAEVSLQQAAEVQLLRSGAPSPLVVSALCVLLAEVQPLQLSLQVAGQGAEAAPLPRRGGSVAGQQRLRAGVSQDQPAALVRLTVRRPLGVGATALLPPPPGASSLRCAQLGPPQGAGRRSVSEEGAQDSQHAGLRLQTTETQEAQNWPLLSQSVIWLLFSIVFTFFTQPTDSLLFSCFLFEESETGSLLLLQYHRCCVIINKIYSTVKELLHTEEI